MFENMTSAFNGMFGKIAPGKCRLTMNGEIAVQCSSGYKTYNVKKGTLTNVSNFCLPMGDEMFFVIPTARVVVGDIIFVSGKPKCVTAVNKNVITVIDYENSEIRQVVPERHIFMGNSYFYGKVVSMFGNYFKSGKGFGNIIKMMLMSQIMGGNKSNGSTDMFGGMGQMMAMSALMGGKNSMFEDMFSDLNFDLTDSDEEVDEENTDTKE